MVKDAEDIMSMVLKLCATNGAILLERDRLNEAGLDGSNSRSLPGLERQFSRECNAIRRELKALQKGN